ncbi:MAG: prolipoprotein diacylglyceryl transferase [Erysipelotrichaceae bacterium]|nr:prolipoprotein diacylglyceryl transferase [Erysipelotrichaceae bacterium]
MISFFHDPQTFLYIQIGSFSLDIRWYAILIMTGAFIAYFVAKKDAKEAKYIDDDFFDSVFIYTLWVGIIGARLWFCAFYDFNYYISNPLEIIKIWDGGLAIQGGLVAGLLYAYYYCSKHHYPFLKIMDIFLPNVLIGQGVGRWGNFVNQECHGAEVAESYFNGILSFLKEGMYINGHYYEPLFFYESVLCILGWFIIHEILKKYQNKRGDLTYAYLMWYSVIRFFIEGHRTDSLYLGPLKMAQLTAIVMGVIGLLGYLGVYEKFFPKKKPTLIFDMDGTMISTNESIVGAYEEVFRVFDKIENFTEERRKEVIGPSLKKLFPVYFPDYDYDTLYKVYREKQIEISKITNHPLPGVVETMKTLHEQGYDIGIVSTRSNEGVKELLEDFDMSECVNDICGVFDVEKVKPDPEGVIKLINRNGWNKDCVIIGDSMLDQGCAVNYGAYFVAFLSNPDIEEEIKAAANDSITDMNELIPILEKDISFTYNLK